MNKDIFVEKLAKKLDVSKQAMTNRLKNIGILS